MNGRKNGDCDMEYIRLGRTGLKVSRLCLGTMNFGATASEKDCHDIMNEALDSGINFFDTANVYGGKGKEGLTEQIIGRWLVGDASRRDQIVLATKVYGRMGAGPNDRGLSAYHIKRACEDSLRRLRTDHIDLYQFHHIDREIGWDEVWMAAEQLVREGKVIYFGSSNFAGWHIARAQGIAQHRNFMGLVSEQSLYNLSQRTVELEVLPACREYGLGFIAWSPLAGGLLAGIGTGAKGTRRSRPKVREAATDMASQLDSYHMLCEELGEPPARVALAWLYRNELVTCPIQGPRTVEQLRDARKALYLELSPKTLGALDLIWPGPGNEAPEAYAW